MAKEAATHQYSHACALLAAERTADAIQLLLDAVAEDENNGRFWSLLGVAQWSAGRVKDSIASLETAMTLAPLGPEGRFALALGYEAIEKRELAVDLFVDLSKEEGLPARLLEPLTRALGRAGLPAQALALCQEASRREPLATGPLRGAAFYLTQLGKAAEEVLPTLFRAFHLDPDDFDTRLLLARRLHDSGRSGEAAYLLSVLDIETLSCPNCLLVMHSLFAEAGDEANATRCLAALRNLSEMRGNSRSNGCECPPQVD